MKTIFICLLIFILVFNYTLKDLYDDNLSQQPKWWRYREILSPILYLLLFYLLYFELLSNINTINGGGSIQIDGSLLNLIGLVIFVANGSGLALNLIHSENIPIIHKVLWVFVGGLLVGGLYWIILQFNLL
jgi:hypothetical protein